MHSALEASIADGWTLSGPELRRYDYLYAVSVVCELARACRTPLRCALMPVRGVERDRAGLAILQMASTSEARARTLRWCVVASVLARALVKLA